MLYEIEYLKKGEPISRSNEKKNEYNVRTKKNCFFHTQKKKNHFNTQNKEKPF